MRRRPLLAVGLALTVLAAALLTWVMQRGGEPVQASGASTYTATASPTYSPTASPTPSATRPSPSPSTTATKKPAPTNALATDGLRLRIPAIGVDRRMHGEGVTSEGKIDPEPGTVMWFQGFDRVRPGAVGTSVIAAHVESGGKADVFAHLADVEVGDKVQLYENGKTVSYRVTRASVIDKNKVPTDQTVWGPNSSRTRLAIITCDEAFGFREDGHRRANFVVIAERV